jgi:hypothetical protein
MHTHVHLLHTWTQISTCATNALHFCYTKYDIYIYICICNIHIIYRYNIYTSHVYIYSNPQKDRKVKSYYSIVINITFLSFWGLLYIYIYIYIHIYIYIIYIYTSMLREIGPATGAANASRSPLMGSCRSSRRSALSKRHRGTVGKVPRGFTMVYHGLARSKWT